MVIMIFWGVLCTKSRFSGCFGVFRKKSQHQPRADNSGDRPVNLLVQEEEVAEEEGEEEERKQAITMILLSYNDNKMNIPFKTSRRSCHLS